jgi:hypothetical protein
MKTTTMSEIYKREKIKREKKFLEGGKKNFLEVKKERGIKLEVHRQIIGTIGTKAKMADVNHWG